MSFRPTPNYVALAEAAAGSEGGFVASADNNKAWMKGTRVRRVGDLKKALELAELRVVKQQKGMLIEVLL